MESISDKFFRLANRSKINEQAAPNSYYVRLFESILTEENWAAIAKNPERRQRSINLAGMVGGGLANPNDPYLDRKSIGDESSARHVGNRVRYLQSNLNPTNLRAGDSHAAKDFLQAKKVASSMPHLTGAAGQSVSAKRYGANPKAVTGQRDRTGYDERGPDNADQVTQALVNRGKQAAATRASRLSRVNKGRNTLGGRLRTAARGATRFLGRLAGRR